MNLIIIGNGFDLAHNLNTKYSDFKEYLKRSNDGLNLYKRLSTLFDEDQLWNRFEYELGNLRRSDVLNRNRYYLKSYSDEHWSDSFHHDYQEHINNEIDIMPSIRELLKKWILSINTNEGMAYQSISSLLKRNSKVLSFNYTNTLETIYGIPHDQILYVHGYAYANDVLVVGHHNYNSIKKGVDFEMMSEDEKESYYEHILSFDVRILEAEDIVNNYFIDAYKDTLSIVENNKLFFESLIDVTNVYVLGHSMNEVDYDYYRIIASSVNSDCFWYIYVHDEEDIRRAELLIQDLKIEAPYYKMISSYDELY